VRIHCGNEDLNGFHWRVGLRMFGGRIGRIGVGLLGRLHFGLLSWSLLEDIEPSTQVRKE
jgi:hypothetical protein